MVPYFQIPDTVLGTDASVVRVPVRRYTPPPTCVMVQAAGEIGAFAMTSAKSAAPPDAGMLGAPPSSIFTKQEIT
ncbi:hypothetical protein D3C86_1224260 [compost metagenome]